MLSARRRRRLLAFSLWIGIMMLLIQAAPVSATSIDQTALKPKEIKLNKRGPISYPSTNARAAALIDVESGRLLYSENGDTELPMASTTKIMTAIVAIESGKLHEMVKTSKRAFGKEGSSIYLRLGEEMKLEDMIYGLMLRSGNDAATAIAEHVGGSEEGFVHMMNEKAREIGLLHTSFRNPHGLDDKEHYTTANDLARLTAYALHNPLFRHIVKTKVKTAPNPNDAWDYKWMNKNKMLSLYEGADGVKTGYTKTALRCLVSSATRNGQQLAAVTLNDGSDWVDHSRMLDYGFEAYPSTTLFKRGQPVEGSSFVAMLDWSYPLSESEKEQISYKIIPYPPTSVEYKFGTPAKLEIYFKDERIGQVPLKSNATSSTKKIS